MKKKSDKTSKDLKKTTDKAKMVVHTGPRSLEKVMQQLLKGDKKERWPLLKYIPKVPAFNTVEEYNSFEQGKKGYSRQVERVKYITGTTSLSIPSKMVDKKDKLLKDTLRKASQKIMDIAEKGLFWGDSIRDYNIPKGAGFTSEGSLGDSLDEPIEYLEEHVPEYREWPGLNQWIKSRYLTIWDAKITKKDIEVLASTFKKQKKRTPTDLFLPGDVYKGPKKVKTMRIHNSRYLHSTAFVGVLRKDVI